MKLDLPGATLGMDLTVLLQGDVYNSTLWDASILRLNQLGYFEALKENDFNDYYIRCAGTHVTIKVNGKKINTPSVSPNHHVK